MNRNFDREKEILRRKNQKQKKKVKKINLLLRESESEISEVDVQTPQKKRTQTFDEIQDQESKVDVESKAQQIARFIKEGKISVDPELQRYQQKQQQIAQRHTKPKLKKIKRKRRRTKTDDEYVDQGIYDDDSRDSTFCMDKEKPDMSHKQQKENGQNDSGKMIFLNITNGDCDVFNQTLSAIERDQKSQSFFKKTPVTCLTAVVSKGTDDGGPHFRKKQVLWSLLTEDALRPGVNFEINFFEKHHRKGAPDQVFGFYSQGLTLNMPKQSIHFLSLLATELHLLTIRQAALHGNESLVHDIIILNYDMFDFISNCLDIDRFKYFLSFIERDGKVVARPLTGIDQIGEQEYELKSLEHNVRGTPKRSTVPIFSS
ncbi:MAG: hypothetical protein EZS28_026319 [Streblomastix strix]|uniref:Uncharacterized protein n=1 Tax=Streblomastix strix TaxID=222440 RepID=A0A5J4V6V6_9EUKA|nr:MAG: hypothetical protein EZS28_026319 [Streblomastix strix]